MNRRILFLSVAGAFLLGGCATIPQPLQGTFQPVTLAAARSGTASATPVRWGGQIIQTEPQPQQTCFFILAQQLDSQARPKPGEDNSAGRFVACKAGFYDPEVFTKGREVTITGTLDGTVEHKIGDFEYTYPRVAANNIYLWKPRPVYVNSYYGGFGGPWGPWGDPFWGGGWGPWGYGYGGWGGGWYRPVIVVPRSPAPPHK